MKNIKFLNDLNKPDQDGNINWWEANPMNYDWENKKINNLKEGSIEWYNRIDSEFWDISKEFAHKNYPSVSPYSDIMNLKELKGKKVLEIGCGMGSHSSILAQHASELVSIDITQKAVDTTKKRFELFKVMNAKVLRVDAENMPFADNEFDFIWSWGVIHHSSNTKKIVSEIKRVLKPKGMAQLMIYNKNSTRYYLHGLYQGIFKLKFLKYNSLYQVNMTFTDGYIARHYSKKTARKLFQNFSQFDVQVMDSGIPSLFMGYGRLSKMLPSLFTPINMFINRNFGWFLFITVCK